MFDAVLYLPMTGGLQRLGWKYSKDTACLVPKKGDFYCAKVLYFGFALRHIQEIPSNYSAVILF